MGRRNEHSQDEQRDMAITAAEALLEAEGPAGVTMRKVAGAIGYTVGNLYLLFRNQDDLLATVNERTGDTLHDALRTAVDKARTPRNCLRALARAYLGYALDHPHRFRLLFEHRLPSEMRDRPSAEQRIRRLFDLVDTALAPWQDGHTAKARRMRATAFWSACHGVGVLAVGEKLDWSGQPDPAALCDTLVDTLIDGLGAA